MEDVNAFKRASYETVCRESVPKIMQEHYVPAINELLKPAGVKVDLVDVHVKRTAPLEIGWAKQLSSQEYIRPTMHTSGDAIVGKFMLSSTNPKEPIDYSPINATDTNRRTISIRDMLITLFLKSN